MKRIERIALENQRKVLEAFWAERWSEADMSGSTGYGLDDAGRDKLERVFARVFGAERALVRPQIVSGTHAIRLALFGVLRPGDEVVFATGKPYDTLEAVVGMRDAPGSLAEWGIRHDVVPLTPDGRIDADTVLERLTERTRVVFFQRSRGYAARPAFGVEELGKVFRSLRARRDDIIILVDNCYGEFTETMEPTAVGADLVMGSLIKNPGGGLAPTGGYVIGRARLVEQAAAQWSAPGIGAEVGPTLGMTRPLAQGLFLAPHVVGQALKVSVLAAYVFERLGLRVSPRWDDPRADLILAVSFSSPRELLAFCQAVQASAPVDAHVTPHAAPMAGYEDDVVMAAGTFIQGGSLELTADAPLRPPYTGYFQGGLTYEHGCLTIARVAEAILRSREEGRWSHGPLSATMEA